ncbi:MAG: hypothetical protein KGJ86_12485 [Chloroflexota bacterium]|nr:hypothetical protein [Chloroflexota bacterium]
MSASATPILIGPELALADAGPLLAGLAFVDAAGLGAVEDAEAAAEGLVDG